MKWECLAGLMFGALPVVGNKKVWPMDKF